MCVEKLAKSCLIASLHSTKGVVLDEEDQVVEGQGEEGVQFLTLVPSSLPSSPCQPNTHRYPSLGRRPYRPVFQNLHSCPGCPLAVARNRHPTTPKAYRAAPQNVRLSRGLMLRNACRHSDRILRVEQVLAASRTAAVKEHAANACFSCTSMSLVVRTKRCVPPRHRLPPHARLLNLSQTSAAWWASHFLL